MGGTRRGEGSVTSSGLPTQFSLTKAPENCRSPSDSESSPLHVAPAGAHPYEIKGISRAVMLHAVCLVHR